MPWQNASLPVTVRVEDLVSRLDATGLVGQLLQNGIDVYLPGLQLPAYIVSQECLAGFDGGDIYIAPPVPITASSGFPQPVNMGNTWDVELVREIASAISDEARAAFVHAGRPSLTCMSPNLNVNRDPRWGRNIESFSEEPSLIASLGSAYITGLQEGLPSEGGSPTKFFKVFAVPKHLGAYSVECYSRAGPVEYPNCPVYRNTYDAVVDEIDLRETYLPGWEAAVKESHAQGVMCSYNSVNGVPACGHGELLASTLFKEWGFPGLVISDADAVALIGTVPDAPPLVRGHGYVPSEFKAALMAFKNGTTVSLEDGDPLSAAFATQLPLALTQGNISLSELRVTVSRALLPRFLTGLYDPPASVPWNSLPASVIEGPAHHALARRAAAASFVLLKNENGLLPLLPPSAGGPKRIALVGPTSNCSSCGVGRYSGHPNKTVGLLEGMSAAAGAVGAQLVFGGEVLSDEAIDALAGADVGVIVLVGEEEGESHDRFSIALPPQTQQWLSTLGNTTKTPLPPLVVLLVSGGAVDISTALPCVGAVLALYTGGMEVGSAAGDVLWGSVNPSGALAHTVYKSSWVDASDFLNMSVRSPPGRGNRYLTPNARKDHVLFELGYGLSYTSWGTRVVNVLPVGWSISAQALISGANVSLDVEVMNTGGMWPGDRVVHCFLSRVGAPPLEEWPVSWLPRRGFAKVAGVEPGGTALARLVLSERDFSRWDVGVHAFTVRVGQYELLLRDSNDSFTITVTD